MRPDIVLVYPDVTSGRFTGFRKHLGAGYLLASLEARGISGRMYEAPGALPLRRAADAISALAGSYVGFTCFDYNFYYVRILAREIKRRRPDLTIVAGGPSATFSSDLILAHVPEMSVCFRGMAEDTLPQFIEAASPAQEQTPGVTWRGDGRVVHNPPQAPGGGGRWAADRHPSPFLSGVFAFEHALESGVLSSRGCFYQCTFCNFAAMANRRIAYHSPDRVLAELVGIRDAVARSGRTRAHVVFNDDFFTASRSRLASICDGIIAARIPERLAFKCSTRADWVDRDTLVMLKAAGFRKVVFGLESASVKVLAEVKKLRPTKSRGDDPYGPETAFLEQIRRAVSVAKEVGLDVYTSVIFGLPGETPVEAGETLAFVRSLPVDGYNHNYLQIFPGTELFTTCDRYGLRVQASPTILPYSTYYAYDVTAIPALDRDGNIRAAREQIGRDLAATPYPADASRAEGLRAVRVEVADRPLASAAAAWLAEHASPETRLVCDVGAGPLRPEDVFPALIEASAPMLNYVGLYIAQSGAGEGVACAEEVRHGTRTGRDVLGLDLRRVRLERLVQLWDGLLDATPASDAYYTSVIADRVDLALIDAFLSRRAPHGLLSVTDAFLAQPMEIANLCQFGLRECPVRRSSGLPVAVVDKRGGIRPCGPGPLVGALRSDPAALRAVFDARASRAAEVRGCASCLRASQCSTCPTLDCRAVGWSSHDPAVARFAEFFMHRAEARTLVKRIGAACQLVLRPVVFAPRDAGRPVPAATADTGVSWPIAVLTVTDGRSYYMCDLDSGAVYEFNRPTMEMYEALASGTSESEMVGYFSPTYGKTGGDVIASVREAHAMFADLFRSVS